MDRSSRDFIPKRHTWPEQGLTVTMAQLTSTLNIRDTLFTTNQAPSADESEVIDATLVRLRAELKIENQSTTQDAHLSDIAASIVRLEGIRNPIRYIPDDVLGLIFAFATPWCFADGMAEDSFPPKCSTDPTNPPWTLSYVCRNWRALALSLPQLWSTCRLYLPDDHETELVKMIETIYQRSEPHSLRLFLGCFDSKTIFPALLPATHRWRCIRIDTSEFEDVPLLSTIFHNRPLPCLTHLSWHLGSLPKPRTTVLAPRLRHLELLYANINDGLVIPWAQITRYRSFSSDLEYIERMQSLEEIVIEEGDGEIYNDYTEVPETQGTILPNVTRIERDNEDSQGFDTHTWLFTRYNFTALRTLVIIEATRHPHYPPSLPYTGFSLPSVVELSLSFEKADDVRNILRVTPNVQSLYINSKYGREASLVHSDFPGHPSVARLMKLKNLSFTLAASARADLAALDDAVAILKLYDVPLETISFYNGIQEDVSASDKARWISHIRRGMANTLAEWGEQLQVLYHYNEEHYF